MLMSTQDIAPALLASDATKGTVQLWKWTGDPHPLDRHVALLGCGSGVPRDMLDPGQPAGTVTTPCRAVLGEPATVAQRP